ncbi:NAD(P)-binding domain-containing protein [Nocardioides sp. KIGAM211]|uniref:NAD(P)-binding domain-containing protein n=1 Tax=Nocardioides luti TaxID=2761101 RepID=A0A7X0V8X1_9ACTN|nr:pyrroline-5-carboxylate reductase dimerization domain-containing protein [Nocardioides luti]MBB6625991.1 NAD(P)-binding domain-containing protein [Nocardioides luti]
MPTDPTYGVIGVGALAAAIVTGLCEGVEDAPQVLLSPRGRAHAEALAARFPTVRVAADNQAVVDGAGTVLVAVLPQQAEAVLGDLTFGTHHLVVSLVAGVPLADLARWATPAGEVVRANPLPSAAAREGMTTVHPPVPAVTDLFARVGRVLPVAEETAYDALSAASATVAAHYAYLDAIAGWLATQGVDGPEARGYVAAVFSGVADTLRTGDGGPPDLAGLTAEVATPGGLNEQLTADLRAAGVYDAVDRALSAVLARTVAPN